MTVTTLLARGADVNARDETEYGFTALMGAVLGGHTDIVNVLLDSGADVNAQDAYGSTALIVAASEGHADIVKLLLDSGADLHIQDEQGWTALGIAAWAGDTVIFEALKKAGAEEDISVDLAYAVATGNSAYITAFFARSADIPWKKPYFSTLLGLAAWHNRTDVVESFVDHGVEIPATALIDAAFRGHTDIVNVLLNSGADVNAQDEYGDTALIAAASEGHIDMVKLLLDREADVHVANDKALELALSNEHTDIVQLLISTPTKIWKDSVTGMEFVWIPGGCFRMGQTHNEKRELIKDVGEKNYKGLFASELPRHQVCVDGFWMGKYEVTNAQYRTWKREHDSEDYEGHSLDGDTQPAVYVSWDEAQEFADWLTQQNGGKYTYRLPTEAEWEYAARAGTTTSRFWGDDPDDACRYANVRDTIFEQTFPEVVKNWKDRSSWFFHDCDDGYAVAAPVGKFRPNAFELYDMLGNVWEWCEDPWHENYQGAATDGSAWSEGGDVITARVLRGGSWGSDPGLLRCANRIGVGRVYGNFNRGFRLVRAAGVQ